MTGTVTLTVNHFDARATMMKAGRKRKADGRLVKSASDARLSFRDSLYSEKAAAMIESSINSTSLKSLAGALVYTNALQRVNHHQLLQRLRRRPKTTCLLGLSSSWTNQHHLEGRHDDL